MDEEIDADSRQGQWKTYCKIVTLLAFQSFGVVYGDLSTSPLHVYRSALSGRLNSCRDEATIFGLFSLIFLTLTLIPLLKRNFCFVLTALQACKVQSASKPASSR